MLNEDTLQACYKSRKKHNRNGWLLKQGAAQHDHYRNDDQQVQLYMEESWLNKVVTVSEVISALTSAFIPTMAYTTRETMVAGTVV